MDFNWIGENIELIATIVTACGLYTGLKHVAKKDVKELSARFDKMEEKFDKMEEKLDKVNERTLRIEGHLFGVNYRNLPKSGTEK